MALKAGRVGVAPSEVDEFGQIIGEITPTNVYTKTQTDELFEKKTNIFRPCLVASANDDTLEFTFDSAIARYSTVSGVKPASVFLLSVGRESVGALMEGSGLYMICVGRDNGTAVYVTPIKACELVSNISVSKQANSSNVSVTVTLTASNYYQAYLCKIG